jgi:hypothetical protein
MTTLVRFLDKERRGTWANVVMDDGSPCWIGIAQTGVLIKKSKVGLFGKKLYEEKEVYVAAEKAKNLSELYSEQLVPDDMTNPVLRAFTNAILHCSTLIDVSTMLARD